MSRDRAAYMRDYRAKQRPMVTEVTPDELLDLRTENERLTAEVTRLKRELTRPFASRSDEIVQRHHPEFRPVPKPGRK